MIDQTLTAFGTGGVGMLIFTAIGKIITMMMQASQQKTLLAAEKGKLEIDQMDALAKRTDNWWGHMGRFILLLVPQFIMVWSLVMGYFVAPDFVLHYGHTNSPENISFFFGLFEYTSKPETTWREFNGAVVFPMFSLQGGATVGYYLGNSVFSTSGRK